MNMKTISYLSEVKDKVDPYTSFHHPLWNDYVQFYQLPHQDVQHSFGRLPDCDSSIMVQIFTPGEFQKDILLLHGYYDHVGVLKHLIHFFLSKHYRVTTFDLPGHGLSEGKRAYIENFRQYQSIFSSVLAFCQGYAKGKLDVCAHSTGSSIVIQHLLSSSNPFHQILLIAPLIRSYFWKGSLLGMQAISPMKKEILRVIKKISSDPEYIHFMRKDPLQYKKLPLDWVQALIRWNEQIMDAPVSQVPLFIFQGDLDKTVDWKYNLSFLMENFPCSRVMMIPKGNHHLFNESPDIKQMFFEQINSILK